MKVIVSFALYVLITGCMTVPEDRLLLIESNPLGVEVASDAGWSCVTPCERRVRYDSKQNLTLTESNYEPTTVEVDVPPFKPSRTATYIGVGIGAVTMALGADFIDAFNSALIEALTGSETDFLTSGEKITTALAGGVIFGAVGYGIDRARDRRKMQKELRVHVEMVEKSAVE